MEDIINLRELLKQDFDLGLPITGGSGNSKDNPIIIEPTRNPVDVEYAVLTCLGIGRNVEWKVLGQELFTYNGKRMDKIKIEVVLLTETQIITTIENYYFQLPDTQKQPNWLFRRE